jgi:hypothetical protein
MVVENMQTAYQVGKGMLKHVEEMARQAEERDNPPEPEFEPEFEPEEMDDEADAEKVLAAAVEEDVADGEDPVSQEVFAGDFDDQEDAVYAAPAPRRMKFRTEGAAA